MRSGSEMLRRAPRGRRGVALVAAVITVFSAAALLSVALTLARANDTAAAVDTDRLRARFLAEGALEVATRRTQELIANWQLPTTVVSEFALIDGVEVPYTIAPNGFIQIVTQTSGIKDFATGYELTARAAIGDSVRTMRRIIKAQATPIFQFAVFYTDDLEIHNGPNMNLAGRVHTNADMFLSPNGSTLTMDTNYVRAVGDILRHRKTAVSQSNGTVNIRKWVDNPFDPSEPKVFETMHSKSQLSSSYLADSVSGYDSNFTELVDHNGDGDYDDQFDLMPFAFGSLDIWGEPFGYSKGSGSTVMTQDHGLGAAVTPSIGSIELFTEVEPGEGGYALDPVSGLYVPTVGGTHDPGFFAQAAGLKLVLEPDGSGGEVLKAYDGAGNDLSSDLVDTGVVHLEEFYDARQADGTDDPSGMVQAIAVDIEALNASGHFPPNGLLYAGSYFLGDELDAGGLLLHDGEELAGKLTCVSEGSVYVQGDYNTVDKKGAAAIGDAVNLLSNSWNGSKSKGTLPKASNTTFNLALITGNLPTAGNKYNGGLENLPRFHENWTGRKASINGSFVNTWFSDKATGAWEYGGDRYQAPIRDWSYDQDFNDFAKLPPFTPLAVWAEEVTTW
jgi:hypothetical protein